MTFDFKSAREAIGLGQKDLAEKLDVSLSTYRKWEQRNSNPCCEYALKAMVEKIQSITKHGETEGKVGDSKVLDTTVSGHLVTTDCSAIKTKLTAKKLNESERFSMSAKLVVALLPIFSHSYKVSVAGDGTVTLTLNGSDSVARGESVIKNHNFYMKCNMDTPILRDFRFPDIDTLARSIGVESFEVCKDGC